MEMHQIRYFLAVAREANFTRAARGCNVSQPSLSRAIMHLEKEFGGPLFLRERSKTRLTELGSIVEPFLRAAIETAQSAKSAAREFAGRKVFSLKIGVMNTLAPEAFAPLLLVMRAKHPGVALSICGGRAEEMRKGLLEGWLDAAIYALPEDAEAGKLQAIPLCREQMVIAVNAGHRLAAMEAIDIRALDGEPCVWRMNCEYGALADRVFEARGVATRVVHCCERDDLALTLVASGAGFALMPQSCLTRPGVVGRPLLEPEMWREVNFMTARGRPLKSGMGDLAREAAALRPARLDSGAQRAAAR